MANIKYNGEYSGSATAEQISEIANVINANKIGVFVRFNFNFSGCKGMITITRHLFGEEKDRYFLTIDYLTDDNCYHTFINFDYDFKRWNNKSTAMVIATKIAKELNRLYEEKNAVQTEEATATETEDKEPKIHEVLVISAIKDAIKTNSTDEYSVGGGYTISINDEHIKVSVPNENRTIDYRISDWATEDEWLFNKEEVIKKIAKNIMGDIYIDPNGYDGVPTFEQSQFAINALMEDDNAPAAETTNDEDEYAEVISTESGVWYIESDINIEDYMENGYDKPLPEDVQNWLHEQEIIVCYDSYPYYKDNKVIDHAKRITSPKTYGDLIKPYVDYLAEIDKEAANDSSWECLHTPDCLWVEGFKIEAKLSRLIKNNAFAEIYIGS